MPGGSFLQSIVKLSHLKSSPTKSSHPRLSHTSWRLAAFGLLVIPFSSQVAQAQDIVSPPVALPGAPGDAPVGVETVPANPPAETAPTDSTPVETPGTETPVKIDDPQAPTTAPAVGPVNSGRDLPAPAAPPSRLTATQFSTLNGIITAEGTTENPVRFVTAAAELTALRIQLDTVNQTVEASGQVRLERVTQIQRRDMRARSLGRRRISDTARETFVGQNLHYDFKNGVGKLDNANVQLASLSISASSLFINGRSYSAKDVLLRPGALSEEERKIYGTPPFNIRAKSITATTSDVPGKNSVVVKGGGLFFKNTKILPLPSYIFRAGLGGGDGEESTFKITPGISLNSADRILLTTKFAYPLSKNPQKLLSTFDVGLSQRVGLRGGIGLESSTGAGRFTLRARRSDIVETQLTNRIELDRTPELSYRSPSFATFALPGGRIAGFSASAVYGDYAERTIGTDNSAIKATRLYGRLLFTTRLKEIDGPYLRLFVTSARYGDIGDSYRSRGFEVGYEGPLLSRVRGRIALSSTSLAGQTPFRFDRIEIARELRTTVDIQLTPRYILPLDLRYDLSRNTFRDKKFGILRSYKTFAYGIVYQSARQDLRLEVRQGF
jgi:hypothetical protein